MGVGSSRSTKKNDKTRKTETRRGGGGGGVEVSDVDRAVLKLKTQLKKLERQYNGARSREEAERTRAKDFMAKTVHGRRDTMSARNALKRAAALGKLAENLAGMQMQVQSMLVDIDAAARDRDTLRALSCGNEALRTLQKEFGVDRAEEVLREYDETKDAMMSWGLTLSAEEQGDVDLLEEELEKMQRDIEQEERGAVDMVTDADADADADATTKRAPEEARKSAPPELEEMQAQQEQREEEDVLRLPDAPTHALPIVDATATEEAEEDAGEMGMAQGRKGRVAMLEPA